MTRHSRSENKNGHRIALVTTELGPGGAERCLVNLAAKLDRTQFNPAVFALAPPPSPPQNALVAQLEQAGVPVHFLGFSRKRQLFFATRELTRQLASFRPHLVQSMLFHANTLTRWALRAQPATRWCAGIRVADPSRFRQAIGRRTMRRADRVVCVSNLVAEYATETMHIPEQQRLVIPNGIDVDAIEQRRPAELTRLGLPRSRRAITCVARLSPQKGLDQLLSVAPRMLAALPGHDLLVVGQGPESDKLQRLAASGGIADRVHFRGWQPDVPAILLASDLFVLPSRWEGMPNVLLEAMACSCPVVCTPAEGVLEVLGPLSEPQTVSARDPQLLSETIVTIMNQPNLARRLGRQNRRRVTHHFGLSAMVQRYEKLYASLLHGPATGRK